MLKSFAVLLGSFLGHFAIMCLVSVGLFAVGGFRDPRLLLVLAIALVVVATLGFLKEWRWVHKCTFSFSAGVILGAVGGIALLLTVFAVIAHPVAPYPPFSEQVAGLLRVKNAAYWLAGPPVLGVAASAAGQALARWLVGRDAAQRGDAPDRALS